MDVEDKKKKKRKKKKKKEAGGPLADPYFLHPVTNPTGESHPAWCP